MDPEKPKQIVLLRMRDLTAPRLHRRAPLRRRGKICSPKKKTRARREKTHQRARISFHLQSSFFGRNLERSLPFCCPFLFATAILCTILRTSGLRDRARERATNKRSHVPSLHTTNNHAAAGTDACKRGRIKEHEAHNRQWLTV